MFVKPHPDRTVRVHKHGEADGADAPLDVLHPHTRQPIPRGGMDVPEDGYWMRRLAQGDVVLADAPKPKPEPPAPEPTNEEHAA